MQAMGRRLGQHFLRPASVERALRAIAPGPNDVFLEIGPGRGALTLPLAWKAARVVAVELDANLARDLAARAPSNVAIVVGDALEIDLAALVPRGARVVGNLPYYVSSPLLGRFLSLHEHVSDLHVMLQDEVARRIAAGPGTKDYGVLSVFYAAIAETSIPERFPAACFVPAPRVDSALLRARFLDPPPFRIRNQDKFEKLVGRAFAHRRKTLENNLQDSYPNLKEYLRFLKIEGTRRAETLSVGEFVSLAERLDLE